MEAISEPLDKTESEVVASVAAEEKTTGTAEAEENEKSLKKKRATNPKTPKEPKKPRAITLKKSTAFLSPEKAAADRNALLALGMSVSKKNLDTMQTKKTVVKEVTRKRRLNDLETSIASLEEKEKKEKDDLAKLKKQKLKLESDAVVKFPVADELIESLDPKGPKLTPLPTPVPKAGLPDELLTDVLFIWNFLYVFSDELHLKPLPFDDLVNVLNFSTSDSFVLVEIMSSLLRLLLRDHSLAVQISSQVPSHLNFASKETVKSALENLKESAIVERHRDWSYNGLKLLPKKIRVDVVDGLRWQSVLRCVLPRLPIFKDLLRASDPSFDMLLALELREGPEGDGYKGSNKDWAHAILANLADELNLVADALTKIESNEFYSLSLLQKLTILRQLCLACYDCAPVRHLLSKHHEERNQSVAHLNAVRNSQKKALRQVSAAMKARATEECRKVNAANLSKGGKKSTKKNPLDPTPAQLNAMLDDLILMDSVKVNIVMEPPDDKVRADSSSTTKGSRAYAADEEKKRRDRELTKKMREDALFYLESAMESGRDKDTRESIRYAKQAGLEGKLPDGKVYCHPMLFKMYRHRANMDQVAKEQKIQAEHEKDLAKLFVRTEPIGYDRDGCAYYCFDGDSRLWVQTLETGVPREAGSNTPAASLAYETLLHVRPSTRRFSWRFHGTMPDIWRVIEALDERGIRERELKEKLVAHFGLSGKSADGATYQTQGSEYIGCKVRRTFGKRVVVGTIVGWLPPEGEDIALWHVVHDDGDEEDLEESEVKDFLVRDSEHAGETEGGIQEIEGDQSGAEKTEAMELEGSEKPKPDSAQDEEDEEPDVFFRYFNNAPGGLSLRPHQIGIDGLRQELLRMAGRLTDGLKSRGSGFQKDTRREWENSVREADSIAQFRDSLRELEEFVHDTQQSPDKVDESSARGKREVMEQDGWIFDSEVDGKIKLEELQHKLTELRRQDNKDSPSKELPIQHEPTEQSLLEEVEAFQRGVSMIGRRGRRFFDSHGKSDGTIVAFMRSGLNDGIALWHMEHDDGDCEDLDAKDLERVLAFFDSDAQEDENDEEEQQTMESGEESNDGSEGEELSEETDDEDDGFQSAGSDLVLWPSLDTRNRWRQALSQSHTVSEVALALSSFMDYAERFGITSPDPLDAYGTSLSLVSRRMWRESMGGRESIGRAPVKANPRTTRSSNNSERVAGSRGKDLRRSSLKAAEGSRRLLRDRAAKKMVSYLE